MSVASRLGRSWRSIASTEMRVPGSMFFDLLPPNQSLSVSQPERLASAAATSARRATEDRETFIDMLTAWKALRVWAPRVSPEPGALQQPVLWALPRQA